MPTTGEIIAEQVHSIADDIAKITYPPTRLQGAMLREHLYQIMLQLSEWERTIDKGDKS